MSDIHVTRELLRAVAQGELSERAFSQIEAQHLASLCSVCRREILAWEQERSGEVGYEYVLDTLPGVLRRHAPDLEERWRQAEQDVMVLLDLPQEERRARIERARSRFRGPFLAELLIQESRRRIPGNPQEAYHLAELARLIVHRSPATPESFDLVALASAHMANACRAGGDLRGAEEHFGFVRYVVTHQGVTDSWVVALIDSLEGSLKKDQRLFPQAEILLNRAAMLFRICGVPIETVRVLLTLGAMYFQQGSLHRAIETTRTALESLPVEAETRLYLSGRYNLALYLTESGRFEAAADLLEADEELYRQFPEPWTQLRLSWLRGKIAAGRGEVEAAERWFLETREGFVREGIGYDAAMVSLDLALLYLKEGRTGDVRRLAEEMVTIFEAQDVHREALAAVCAVPGGGAAGGGDGGVGGGGAAGAGFGGWAGGNQERTEILSLSRSNIASRTRLPWNTPTNSIPSGTGL